jgi:phage terminase small subunit
MAATKQPSKSTSLKPEWELFVSEYLVDLNATKAAQRAGLASETNDRSGSAVGARLLANASVRQAVEVEFAKRLDRIELTQDRVIQELAIIALSDIIDYEVNEITGRLVPLGNRRISRAVQSVKIKRQTWTDSGGTTRSEVTTEIKLWDKLRAVELLMRHMGMLSGDDDTKSKGTIEQRRDRAVTELGKLLERRRVASN